jgi:hypothetical protein
MFSELDLNMGAGHNELPENPELDKYFDLIKQQK